MTKEEQDLLEKAEEIKRKEEKKAKAQKTRKRKGMFMKFTIVFMFIYLTIFTYAVLKVFAKTGTEPSTLIGAVFLFCGWESGCLSKIKINKTKKGVENNEF